MVKKFTREEVTKIVSDYVEKLRTKIKLDQVLLYGSYAKDTANEFSDIDLLIVSSDLPENKPKGANGLLLDKLVGINTVNPSLEVIGIHPNKLTSPITKDFFDEVFTYGISL